MSEKYKFSQWNNEDLGFSELNGLQERIAKIEAWIDNEAATRQMVRNLDILVSSDINYHEKVSHGEVK